MTLWAIVPVKPLRRGKSRLAGTLTKMNDRTKQELLQHTLKTLSNLKEVDGAGGQPRPERADHCPQSWRPDRAGGWSAAIEHRSKRATVVAQVYATRGVLVLPADLPLITAKIF